MYAVSPSWRDRDRAGAGVDVTLVLTPGLLALAVLIAGLAAMLIVSRKW